MDAQCSPKCSVLSSVTPRIFRCGRPSTVAPATLMEKSLASWAHCESTRACVFCAAMLAFQVTAHLASVSAACCALALAIGRELPVLSVAVSSAYMKTDVPGSSLSSAARSADQSVKRVGARTLPWGRPARKMRSSPEVPLISTRALRSRRNWKIHSIMHFGSESRCSFSLSMRWSIVSYALAKSKDNRTNFSAVRPSTGPPLGLGLFQRSCTCWMRRPTCSSAARPRRNPTCSGGTRPSLSIRWFSRAPTTRSTSLARWLVREMGR